MATQDDFAAAKYHAPVALYCGSVPKFKSRYTTLQGGSVDSDTWFCDSSWITEEEALTQDPREREVSSASLETIQIKDKLKKRRMSEGLLPSQKGLTDCSDAKGVILESAVSGPASQRSLITSKPMPPIQNSLPSSEPSGMSDGEQEHGENGTGCGDSDGKNKELMSEDKGHQASLLPLYYRGGNGKKSLGVPLIPPIVKSARPSDEAPGSSAVHLSSSQHQEALEMTPRSSNSSEEKTLESPELRTLEPILPVLQHHVVDAVKSAGHLHEPVPPLAVLPLNQDKEMDRLMSPHLLSDDDLRDSNGRIHVTLSKSAQKKIYQKRMREMELLRLEREKERDKEKSLEFSTKNVDPGVAAKESFGLPPINGMVSLSASTSNACRESAGTALRKRENRSSLPSIHVNTEGCSFPRNSSANSLPAVGLDFLEWGEEPARGASWEARPFPHPQQELLNALTWLKSDDW
ncbi:PREDICTED: LOW QUALITY PROTEIN: protein FAM179A-like [Apaloderma vittatum]|uniref:LOW QUALITY PROTEIN: protein FAM179A-like n=1 Tax=Apaloderma vittatum TaxID=57397 RepID=UPI0005219B68|nr:PREDICTED: LOW QUALITY PROTEIN: protein FAM179A-like [Apaloderma vittatum]